MVETLYWQETVFRPRPASNGMYIRVTVTPGARRERIAKLSDTEYVMEVKEPAERNRANKRVRALLREVLGTACADARMVAGHRSATKVFDVTLQ